MTVGELLNRALGKYRAESVVEDGVFTIPVLLRIGSEAHRDLARRCLLYQEEKTIDLPADTLEIALESDVIRVVPGTVDAHDGEQWYQLCGSTRSALRLANGPLRNADAGTPRYCYLDAGEASRRLLGVFPPSDTTREDGLIFQAYTEPAIWAEESETVSLGEGETDALVLLICAKMSETEASRGRRDAPVGLWGQRAELKILELKNELEQARQPGTRSVRVTGYDYTL